MSVVSETTRSSGARRVLRLLDTLRASPAGELIYAQIRRILTQAEANQTQVEKVYAGLLSTLLNIYARQLPKGALLQTQLSLLDKLLQPPLAPEDLDMLCDFTESQVAQLAQVAELRYFDPDVLQELLSPLLDGFGIPGQGRPERSPQGEEKEEVAAPQPAAVEPAGDAREPVEMPEDSPGDAGGELSMPEHPPAETAPDADEATAIPPAADEPGLELPAEIEPQPERRRDAQELKKNLAQQVSEATAQTEDFGVLLQMVLDELHNVQSTEELEALRVGLVEKVQQMLQTQSSFSSALDMTTDYLRVMETSSQQLTDELSRVRLLSLTDELTGLPNRRAFLRRLEDEVGRVQRYGYNLSLAVIDLDHFKEINDEYGHNAGDAALRCYAREIVTSFRHHDLVARYGGEEFVVLLPNTDQEGAMQSLRKVQDQMGKSTYPCGDQSNPAPKFSAGIALYKAGETPSAFIERADNALYQAKRLGRNRIEVANDD